MSGGNTIVNVHGITLYFVTTTYDDRLPHSLKRVYLIFVEEDSTRKRIDYSIRFIFSICAKFDIHAFIVYMTCVPQLLLLDFDWDHSIINRLIILILAICMIVPLSIISF